MSLSSHPEIPLRAPPYSFRTKLVSGSQAKYQFDKFLARGSQIRDPKSRTSGTNFCLLLFS